MSGTLHKARRLWLRDWLLVGRAWVGLIAAQQSLRRRSFARIWQELSSVPVAAGEPSAERRQEIARSVGAAARVSIPPATCLPRALVLCRMLRGEGAPAEMRIGVRRQGAELQAHAWVESDAVVVGDRQDISAIYAPLAAHTELPEKAAIRGRR